jgi:2-dehydropantoate 2-reductase
VSTPSCIKYSQQTAIAVGSILGWRLSRVGGWVSVICRSNYDQVSKHGFTFRTSLWGDGTFIPHKILHAESFARAKVANRYHYIILANKIKSKIEMEQVINGLRNIVQRDTVLVSTQNGMGNESPLAQAFTGNTILSSVCNMSCSQPKPGFVEQTVAITPHAFHLGIYSKGEHTISNAMKKLESLVAIDPQFCVVPDVHGEKWQKLLFNTAWNSMTAITGVDTHEILRSPASTRLVRQLAEEAYRIGIASGASLAQTSPDDVIELARKSKPIITSSLRDTRKGRKVEIYSITGKYSS